MKASDFTLDGSASSDPDDGIAAYSWSQTLGGPVAMLPGGYDDGVDHGVGTVAGLTAG